MWSAMLDALHCTLVVVIILWLLWLVSVFFKRIVLFLVCPLLFLLQRTAAYCFRGANLLTLDQQRRHLRDLFI